MNQIYGGCHCGNIYFVAKLHSGLATHHLRACDCQFCTTHGAAYLSDEKGSLSIIIQNEGNISRYKQGSGICDFLVCRNCGVLTNVLFRDGHDVYGAINARSVSNYMALSESEAVHLIDLSDEERIQRWKRIWFPNVTIQRENA